MTNVQDEPGTNAIPDLSLLLIVVVHHPLIHPSIIHDGVGGGETSRARDQSASARGRGRRRAPVVRLFLSDFPRYNSPPLLGATDRVQSRLWAPDPCGSRERSTSEETYRLWVQPSAEPSIVDSKLGASRREEVYTHVA